MKRFLSGFLVGTVATIAAAASVVMTVKKQVIDPIDEQQALNEEKENELCVKVSLVNTKTAIEDFTSMAVFSILQLIQPLDYVFHLLHHKPMSRFYGLLLFAAMH